MKKNSYKNQEQKQIKQQHFQNQLLKLQFTKEVNPHISTPQIFHIINLSVRLQIRNILIQRGLVKQKFFCFWIQFRTQTQAVALKFIFSLMINFHNNLIQMQFLSDSEEISTFQSYVNEIDMKKISEISIRRAIKKYDIKNLKINNVTPLRAKKMHELISSKYEMGTTSEKSWLENQRRLFVWCVVCYLFKKDREIQDLTAVDFQFLQSMFPVKDPTLIKFQIYSLLKKNNKHGSWEPAQDDLLLHLVKESNGQYEWSNISKKFFSISEQKSFRSAKQCRQRWLNYLDPNKEKGKWTLQQDITLLSEVQTKGKKWSKIVIALAGKKNEHMIKNRYKSLIHKKEKSLKGQIMKQSKLIELVLQDCHEGKQNRKFETSQDRKSSIYQSSQRSQDRQQFAQMDQEIQKQIAATGKQIQIQQQKNIQQPVENMKAQQTAKKEDIVPKNKEVKAVQKKVRLDPQNIEMQIMGTEADKYFVNNLLFNGANQEVQQENINMPNIMQSRSPSHQSEFEVCWTPSVVLFEDGFASNFSSTSNFFSSLMGEKKN